MKSLKRSRESVRISAIILAKSFFVLVLLRSLGMASPTPEILFDENSFLVSLEIDESDISIVPDREGQIIKIKKVPTQPKIGYPKIPKFSFFLALPPSTLPKIERIVAEEKIEFENIKIATVPKPVIGIERGTKTILGLAPYVAEEFSSSDIWPKRQVEIELVGYMRGLNVARVAVYPVAIDNRNKSAVFYPHIFFEISLTPTNNGRAKDFRNLSSLELGFLRGIVSNFESAKDWRTKPAHSKKYINYEHMCKIITEDEGLFVLTRSDVTDRCGFPNNLDPRKLALYKASEAVDAIVIGETDGSFDSDDLFVFWAERYEDLFTKKNSYILALTDEFGPRATHRTAAPNPETPLSEFFIRNVSVKRDHFYFQQIPFNVEDHWFAEYMIAPTDMTIHFELSGIDFGASGQTTFFSSLYGASYTGDGLWDHHAVIFINDTIVDEMFWNGQKSEEDLVNIDVTLLIEGENEIKIYLPFDTGSSLDIVCPDFFALSHPAKYELANGQLKIENPEGANNERLRFTVSGAGSPNIVALDITDPLHPAVLDDLMITPDKTSYKVEFESEVNENTKFALATLNALESPTAVEPLRGTRLYSDSGADYIIIAHDLLVDSLVGLAEFHENRGVEVEIVSYSELIDAFNYGFYGPDAIRNFLEFIYSSWEKVPTSVLLVGDASYDYKDNYGEDGLDDFLSTLLIDDHLIGDTASDFLLACVDGDDHLPEFSIARLPAHTPDEVEAYVDKLRHYYDSGDNFWRKDFLFVADDGFESSSENAQQYVKSDYPITELFISNYDDIEKLKADLKSSMTQGAVWVDYIGHGGVDVWAHEHILDYQMITKEIHNENRYPFIVVWTCLNGYFDHALISEVIAEGFTLTKDLGAIGIFAPTRVSMGLVGDILAEKIYSLAFENGERTLGVITTVATSFGVEEGLGIWAESYLLFGDPLIELALPVPEDVNGSGRVDGIDLIYLCKHLDGSESDIAKYADINLDGAITEDDFERLSASFGTRAF